MEVSSNDEYLCSVCEYICVVVGHFNRFCYLLIVLTYLTAFDHDLRDLATYET